MPSKFKIEKSKFYKNIVYCKLTDSLSKSFDNFINSKSSRELPKISIKDGKGVIQLPQNSSFSFTIEPLRDHGLTTCHFGEDKFSLTGKVTCKLNVEATVDSLANTRKRIEEVHDEVKQNCVKELKRPAPKPAQKRPPKRQVFEQPPKTETRKLILEDLPQPKTDVNKLVRECLLDCLKSFALTRKRIEEHVALKTKIDVRKNKQLIDKILAEIAIEINSNKGVVYKLRSKARDQKEHCKILKKSPEKPKVNKNDEIFHRYRKIKSLGTEQEYVSCGEFYQSNYEKYTGTYLDLRKVKDKYTNWMEEFLTHNSWSKEAQKISEDMTGSFEMEINEEFYSHVGVMDKLQWNMAHVKKLIDDFEGKYCEK